MASGYHHKPHAVCIPAPSQSHIKAMLKLAKILHHRGFHITFVNTEFNHKRFLKSREPNSLDGLPDFRFEAIPDGIPESGEDATQGYHFGCCRRTWNPIALFYTIPACSFMGFRKFRTLLEKGLAPLKDERCMTNGFLDKEIEWIPGKKDIRLRDLPTFCRTTNPDDIAFHFTMEATEKADKGSAVVLLTYDALEKDVFGKDPLKPMGYSLWKEEIDCLQWLQSKAPNSIVYVNFGSIAVLTPEQLLEFGWGLANTKLPFFWVIRPDLVVGNSAILPPEFETETKDRGLIASWCAQEQVLNHPSVGGFLTHCGWNSIIESVTAGVPMVCWPFFSDQQTNTYYTCNDWGIGMEITEEATAPLGSSSTNLDNLVNQVLLRKRTYNF
ncbi:hypothetical protein M0R45_014525 [Rubus argutus]|uniref:Glycosyltransferase n=1 Tax=Rubus argutus TaxID=59490 RepID=A0AAW1XPC2_RUBAR